MRRLLSHGIVPVPPRASDNDDTGIRGYLAYESLSQRPQRAQRVRVHSPFTHREMPVFMTVSPKLSRYPSFNPDSRRYVRSCFLRTGWTRSTDFSSTRTFEQPGPELTVHRDRRFQNRARDLVLSHGCPAVSPRSLRSLREAFRSAPRAGPGFFSAGPWQLAMPAVLCAARRPCYDDGVVIRFYVRGAAMRSFALVVLGMPLGVKVHTGSDPCAAGDTSCLPCDSIACFDGSDFDGLWVVSLDPSGSAETAMARLDCGP